MPEADVPYDKLQDPYGKTFWPEFKGRDGCRTPIPWESDRPHTGFSEAELWLPVPDAHRDYACALQEQSPESTLNRFRVFIHWRKQFRALIQGSIEVLESSDDSLLFLRCYDEEKVLVAINLTDRAVSLATPENINIVELEGHGFTGTLKSGMIHLSPYDAFFASVSGYF